MSYGVVPGAGLEPARGNPRRILSPLRLPFRHPGLYISLISLTNFKDKSIKRLEAAPGFEPGIKDLQSHALPLGYAAFKLVYNIFQITECSKQLL